MALPPLLRHALSMPPRVVAAKAMRMLGRSLRSRLLGRMLRRHPTYPPIGQAGDVLGRRLGPIDPAPRTGDLRRRVAEWRCHRFDLLGSGPVTVAHGEPAPGFGPWRYPPGRALGRDWRQTIAMGHWPGNQRRAAAILALIADPAYRPIDWQADFRSGWRWSVRCWGTAIAYGHKAGADVKLPWELARLQHLVPMALAFGLDRDPSLVREFENQILDFLGSNPPGWGVNWACAMDVAIRAVNILLARDLFMAQGAVIDENVEDELAAAMLAHGRHVVHHLEWHESERANHYLADICGLAFIAAYLPASTETDLWLAFAMQELATEIPRQFTPDGAGFEASTAYHRLSSEMALYTTALILGLPEERRLGAAKVDCSLWKRKPALVAGAAAWEAAQESIASRLSRGLRFAADIIMPSGRMVQIGDNDSGRFVAIDDRPLDTSHLIDAAKGLFDPPAAEDGIEACLLRSLAGGRRLTRSNSEPVRSLSGPPPEGTASLAQRFVIRPPDPEALAGLEAIAYPDFGLFLWKGPRAFVAVRAGPIGINGLGAHAHNDQLAVEIEIDGQPWAQDPGSFVYTADLRARDAYRSVHAHFAPRLGLAEPARLMAPFRLEDRAQGKAWHFGGGDFLGSHQGFGVTVFRRVRCDDGAIIVEDCWDGPTIGPLTRIDERIIDNPADLAAGVPFSPGYGIQGQR